MAQAVHRDLINEQVYDYIKKLIIYNELQPNEKIDVNQMAQNLRVSKTPVTTALSKLQNDGYVTILPQSGTFVRSFSSSELQIIYKIRASLESTIVETYGAKFDREKLEDIFSRFVAIGESGEDANAIQDKLFALDIEFHAFLMEACDDIIRGQVENIADLTKRSRLQYFRMARDKDTNLYRIKRNVALHCSVIKALLDGDYQQAGQFVYQDIITTFEVVKDYI